jgi:hypothetical protein
MIKLVGIALIVLGVIALVYEGITYTTRDKIIDIGPLQAEVTRKKTIPVSPVVGVAAVGAGVVLLLIGRRRG